MIAPSPDWFVGINSLNTLVNGKFRLENNSFIRIAGTEEGDVPGNFSIHNQTSNPHRPITSMKSLDSFSAPFATLEIKKSKLIFSFKRLER